MASAVGSALLAQQQTAQMAAAAQVSANVAGQVARSERGARGHGERRRAVWSVLGRAGRHRKRVCCESRSCPWWPLPAAPKPAAQGTIPITAFRQQLRAAFWPAALDNAGEHRRRST